MVTAVIWGLSIAGVILALSVAVVLLKIGAVEQALRDWEEDLHGEGCEGDPSIRPATGDRDYQAQRTPGGIAPSREKHKIIAEGTPLKAR